MRNLEPAVGSKKLYSGALSFITFSIQFGGLGNQILVGASLTSLDLDIIFVFTMEVWHLILFVMMSASVC